MPLKNIIRWKGIIFLLALAGIIVALSFIFTDRWLEGQMEAYGSDMVGAKVEFDGVHLSLTGLQMRWKRLQVTDPANTMTNLFETAGCDFDIDLLPLLSKKINIENFALTGLRFNTPRETDGRLPGKTGAEGSSTPAFVREIQKNLENELSQQPLFQLAQMAGKKIEVDSIFALLNLKSPQKIDSLRNLGAQKYQQWETRFRDLPDESDFQAIQAKIAALDPNKIKGVNELQSALGAAKDLQSQLNGYKQTYDAVKTDFSADLKAVKALPAQVPAWVQADFQQALSMAKLPDFSLKNIANILFGRQVIRQIETVTRYVGMARYYGEKYQAAVPKQEKPPRLKGQDIHFGKLFEPPKFWIKKMAISGEALEGLQIAGNAANIVSDQKIIGQPTIFDIGGTRQDQASLKLDATLDYLGDVSKENITLNLAQIPLQNVKLSSFELLPSKIERGKGFIQAAVDFAGGDFRADVQFNGTQLAFAPLDSAAKLDQRLQRISRSIAAAIKEVSFKAAARQQAGDFKFSISSNLDNLVADQLKTALAGELQLARQQLEERVNREAAKYKQQLDALIAEKEQLLTGQLQKVESELKKYDDQVKQVQKDIENKIKGAGGGLLKDLLKKP